MFDSRTKELILVHDVSRGRVEAEETAPEVG